jgi:hypothetical protein
MKAYHFLSLGAAGLEEMAELHNKNKSLSLGFL